MDLAPRLAMPHVVRPMLASPGVLPPNSADWAFEFKWDGARVVAYLDGGRVRLLSRNDLDVTVSYPELQELGRHCGSRQLILDGEIIALNEAGLPSFGALQARLHVGAAAKARLLAAEVPVTFMVFDLLYLDGQSLLGSPYETRRAALAELALVGAFWQTPPSMRGVGAQILEGAKTAGLEGIVAKKLDSMYTPGRRSKDWLKLKFVRTQEVVIGGWTAGQGHRRDRIGALLLGIPTAGGLTYIGKVGTGFTEDALRTLSQRLRAITAATSPFLAAVPKVDAAVATWTEPTLVGEVAFTEWTAGGRLRHPTWRGLRADKAPADVVRE